MCDYGLGLFRHVGTYITLDIFSKYLTLNEME